MDTERQLATVRRIDDIHPIKDADAIELAIIGGWQCVVKKGEFKKGDLGIYCEIDSILPDHPIFEFLRDRKFRIKTIRLRGELSQGIIFPLSILNNFTHFFLDPELDTDVSDIIGVVKYEPPIPTQLAGIARGNFPSVVPKTDEERIQNLTRDLKSYRDDNIEFVVSEKLDGTSVSFMILDDEFHVCSRNLDLKEFDDEGIFTNNTYWIFARENDIEGKLRKYCNEKSVINLAIQGELVGQGIQKNKYKLTGHHVYFFNAFNIDKQSYLTHKELVDLLSYCELEGVPILNDSFHLNEWTVQELLIFADGKSLLDPQVQREGLVFKSKEYHPRDLGKASFKVISNKYLLKNE